MEGKISSVSFSPQRNKALVEFEDGFVFEFNNGKKPRADHVRKLKLKAGERVVAIGAGSEASALRGIGYEIMRDGKIAKGNYAIISGLAEKIIRAPRGGIVNVKTEDDRIYSVCIPPEFIHKAHEGRRAACLCIVDEAEECAGRCGNFSEQECNSCSKRKKQKRFNCFVFEAD